MNFSLGEIETFFYCPRLLRLKGTEKLLPRLSAFEECLRDTFITTEQICLLKNSEITPRKLLRVWDKLWWPRLEKNNITFNEGQEFSVKASKKFTEYSKYDFTSILYPTVATLVNHSIEISGNFLLSSADVLKSNLTQTGKNITIIDFSRKDISLLDAANNIGIRALCLMFYQWKKETVEYISVDISGESDKLKIISSSFRQNDMEETKKMLSLITKGIKEGISYPNKHNCKECGECPSSYLMKDAILLR